jgi:hypothetical protein
VHADANFLGDESAVLGDKIKGKSVYHIGVLINPKPDQEGNKLQ